MRRLIAGGEKDGEGGDGIGGKLFVSFASLPKVVARDRSHLAMKKLLCEAGAP
jgi:hypothetical protein